MTPATNRNGTAFSRSKAQASPVAQGKAIYHTNVMMAVGSDVAVVCSEAVADDKERRHLLASLRRHHEVLQFLENCGFGSSAHQQAQGMRRTAIGLARPRFQPSQHSQLARIRWPTHTLQVVDISRRQMDALCGNVLELEDGGGHPILALSR